MLQYSNSSFLIPSNHFIKHPMKYVQYIQQVEIFNCRESSAFCIKPNGTLEIQISARDGKSPRNAVLRLDLFTKNSTHIKDKDEIGEWK